MMKITSAQIKQGKKGDYLAVEFDDGRKVNVFPGNGVDLADFQVGLIFIDAKYDLIQGEKWLNLVAKGNTESKAQWSTRPSQAKAVEKLQDRKAENISNAQDRNEVMWAKYGACLLVANHPVYKGLLNPEHVE